MGLAGAGQAPDKTAVTSGAPAAKSGWHFLLELYVMFPNMNGNVAVGRLPPSNINLKPGDIFSHFQIGAMLYFEASNEHWVISSDVLYMDLSGDADSIFRVLQGHAEMKQLGWEVAFLRKINPWLSAGIGFQLNDIQSDISLTKDSGRVPFQQSGSLTKTWVDPSLILAVKLPLGQGGKWDFRGRGNIGGFGIGSKIYWQVQAYFDYHVSKLFQVSLGYRAIKMDYETGSEKDYFLYNLVTFGPVVRFGFNF